MVVCVWDRVRPLRACLPFSRIAIVVIDVTPLLPSMPGTAMARYESLQFSAWDVFLKGNWSPSVFVTNYFPIVFFPILYVAAKLIMGAHTVKADKMDFLTNVAEFNAMTCVPPDCREVMRAHETDQESRYDEPPPKNKLEAFWMWLVSVTDRISVSCTSSPCRLPRCDLSTARHRSHAPHSPSALISVT